MVASIDILPVPGLKPLLISRLQLASFDYAQDKL
jgi:hypothetical protein